MTLKEYLSYFEAKKIMNYNKF